jgi:hypothetical protein
MLKLFTDNVSAEIRLDGQQSAPGKESSYLHFPESTHDQVLDSLQEFLDLVISIFTLSQYLLDACTGKVFILQLSQTPSISNCFRRK